MKNITIDCNQIETKRELHECLKEAFGFPEEYGHNLDALHDYLTDIHEETELCFQSFQSLVQKLGPYSQALKNVLTDSEAENEFFFYSIEDSIEDSIEEE